MLVGDAKNYTLLEVFNATLGRMHNVARREHKGFDYDVFAQSVARYFTIDDISGYPFRALPVWLNFGVGIIGRVRANTPAERAPAYQVS